MYIYLVPIYPSDRRSVRKYKNYNYLGEFLNTLIRLEMTNCKDEYEKTKLEERHRRSQRNPIVHVTTKMKRKEQKNILKWANYFGYMIQEIER